RSQSASVDAPCLSADRYNVEIRVAAGRRAVLSRRVKSPSARPLPAPAAASAAAATPTSSLAEPVRLDRDQPQHVHRIPPKVPPMPEPALPKAPRGLSPIS